MSKAILVIDMPKMCKECPICEFYEIIPSIEEYSCAVENTVVDQYDKPNWCPLKPAPELQDVWFDDEESDWERGYNNCVNEIMGRPD